jgi:hypothetical protein
MMCDCCGCGGCWRSCCTALTRSALFLFNLVDCLSGVALVSYGIYLRNAINSSEAQEQLCWT